MKKVLKPLFGVVMLIGFATLCVVGFRSIQNQASEPVLQEQEGQPSVPADGYVVESVSSDSVQVAQALEPSPEPPDGPATVSAAFTPHFSANPKISVPVTNSVSPVQQ